MANLPIAPVKKLAKNVDREARIGDDAVALLIQMAEKTITDVAKEAYSLASYTGRKTIQSQDVRTACQKLGIKIE